MATTSEQVGHSALVGGGQTALHKHKLNAADPPDGVVDFNQQQATALVIENRTDDPASPVDGQIWLRTDL
jgi:hypothetical protein